MTPLQRVFQQYGPAYRQRYADGMPETHRRVLDRLMHCGDGSLGENLFECPTCGQVQVRPCSCGNRHCPNCQHRKGTDWLLRQREDLLPCRYFLVTFTVPRQLRAWLRSHPDDGYEAMFEASSEALKTLARDERFVGADQIGFFGVLHTWGRTLQYHPHIHYIVPAGGLSADRQRWMASRADLFVHVRPLSRLYRGKFRAALKRAGHEEAIDPAVWRKDWVVHSQAVGDGRATLKYLAAYIFRVAISNSRVLAVQEGQVTFRYEESQTGRERKMTLEASEFIRRFLQHVLPRGFVKVRHYGFLSPNAATPLPKIREMICALYEIVAAMLPDGPEVEPSNFLCPACGTPLVWKKSIPVVPRMTG